MADAYKQLTVSDISLLKQLLAVFGKAFNDTQTYLGAQPSDRYLESLLGKPNIIVLTALSDNHVVGGLVAYVLDKFEQERSELYIYDLAVDEKYRRQGIATALIEELKIIAKAKGAYTIYVQADKEDGPAIKLYESFGKKEEVFHFDILPN